MPDQQTITTSKFLSVNTSDWLKALLLAVIGAVLDYLYTALMAVGGSFSTIHWADVGKVAAIAFLGYIGKNFFTPAKTIITPAPVPGPQVVNVPAPGDTTTK